MASVFAKSRLLLALASPVAPAFAQGQALDAFAGQRTDEAYRRSLAHVEHAAAVAIQGNRVCRRVTTGIATQSWLRGTVTAVKGERIAVSIDVGPNPSSVPPSIPSGAQGASSGVVWDAVASWTACE